MSWLRTWRINRAAKRYGGELTKQLHKNWGGGEYYIPNENEYYSPEQITRAVIDAGLDPRYVALGYAAYFPERIFNLLRSEMPIPLPYHEARAAFIRYAPVHLDSAAWESKREHGRLIGGDGYGR